LSQGVPNAPRTENYKRKKVPAAVPLHILM